MPSSQPTILVKKSDGTSVRMSWDDFEKYRASKTQNTVNKTQRVDNRMQRSELPAKIGEEALATTAPVKDIFVDEAKYMRNAKRNENAKKETGVRPIKTQNTINKTQRFSDRMQNTRPPEPEAQSAAADGQADNRKPVFAKASPGKQAVSMMKSWTADDGKSLLEDSVDAGVKNKTTSVLPSKRDDLYDLFIKEIRFPIKDELRGRLNSLAVSFVKGVRTEDQMRGYLQRSEADGGLGFSDTQIEAVIGSIKKVWHLTNTPLAPLREGSLNVPSSEEGGGGVRTHPSPLSERGNLRSSVESEGHKFPPRRRAGEVFGINAKPVLQDVAPPKPKIVEPEEKISMGPIDEIASMTLTDFRRLATGGTDSIQVLREKLSALRKESVIIYLQAMDAWFASPVYKEYQNLIKRAVNERRKLQEVAGESEIKFEEFIKLANLCSSL